MTRGQTRVDQTSESGQLAKPNATDLPNHESGRPNSPGARSGRRAAAGLGRAALSLTVRTAEPPSRAPPARRRRRRKPQGNNPSRPPDPARARQSALVPKRPHPGSFGASGAGASTPSPHGHRPHTAKRGARLQENCTTTTTTNTNNTNTNTPKPPTPTPPTPPTPTMTTATMTTPTNPHLGSFGASGAGTSTPRFSMSSRYAPTLRTRWGYCLGG